MFCWFGAHIPWAGPAWNKVDGMNGPFSCMHMYSWVVNWCIGDSFKENQSIEQRKPQENWKLENKKFTLLELRDMVPALGFEWAYTKNPGSNHTLLEWAYTKNPGSNRTLACPTMHIYKGYIRTLWVKTIFHFYIITKATLNFNIFFFFFGII